MAKVFQMAAAMILVIFLVSCASVQKDWNAESRIAELRKQKEETSRRIAEKLQSKKIRAVVIDAHRRDVPRGAIFHFYPSGKEPQIIAIIKRMELWSLQSGALTLRVSCSGVYQRFGSFDVYPRIALTLEEGGVSYNLADCQDSLAKRLVDEIEKALESK